MKAGDAVIFCRGNAGERGQCRRDRPRRLHQVRHRSTTGRHPAFRANIRNGLAQRAP
jgi:hypothetical protein